MFARCASARPRAFSRRRVAHLIVEGTTSRAMCIAADELCTRPKFTLLVGEGRAATGVPTSDHGATTPTPASFARRRSLRLAQHQGRCRVAYIEVMFSFDTTGSMYPCLTQVRKKVYTSIKQLFKDLPGIKIGVFAHGDYCDSKIYVTKHQALSAKPEPIVKFVEKVKPTYGGDYPEAYELVLHEARKIGWTPHAKKILVMIGDAIPHTPKQNPKKLD